MLDILVIAPHPDDAELGMGGAILKFKKEGRRVGILDLTSGEPTPHGTPEIRKRETAAATAILGIDWRENLGLPNRSLEADDRKPREAGRRDSPAAAAVVVRAVLGRCPSRSHRGDRARRCGPLLVEAHQDRHAGRAASSRADLQLLLRPSENGGAAGVHSRHQRRMGAEAGRDPLRTKASSSLAGRPIRPCSSTRSRRSRLLGQSDRRAATASRSIAASRSG